jgi:fumarylacetoacetase
MTELNGTHDPARPSWVERANLPDNDFPIQNLPFGVFRNADGARTGVAIGDQILDLSAALAGGLFEGEARDAAHLASGRNLNSLMAAGNRTASALRARLSDLLWSEGGDAPRARQIADRLLVPMAGAEMMLPVKIGSFTDFLTSIYHTERGGRITRPDNPVPPPFKYLPIAYNGRATSVRASTEPVRRPNVQWRNPEGKVEFGPCRQLDFELEVGMYVARSNPLGEPIAIEHASDHMFGLCLLNDWSARDIQRWESVLGPFLSKSLSTTVSPWVVTTEALAPFRAPAFGRLQGDPAPLPYLNAQSDQAQGGFDIELDAYLLTSRMRAEGVQSVHITRTNFIHMYWTFAQMLTHHMSNGCNLHAGDLLGSGTTSGPLDENRACLNELTNRGAQPLKLPNGETRGYLEDGDEVIFRARAARDGFRSIGFGECRARIEPAHLGQRPDVAGSWRLTNISHRRLVVSSATHC